MTDSAAAAEEGLRLIEAWHRENPRHQLDWRWFSSYHRLASYSDVGWLTQAGLFSEEEQREWDTLIQNQENAVSSKRMLTLVAQSRKRELAACLEEKREPHFHYPLIPRDDVLSRITELSQLRTEVEQHEPNAIVRRLYLEAIDERLEELHMIAATSRQDDQAFWTYNQRLNTLPSIPEMELALGQLAATLRRGLERSDTRDLAEYIVRQTMSWRIAPLSLGPLDMSSEQEGEEQPSSNEAQKLFSPGTVARFFADVFRNYQFSWTITHDPAADHARVSLSQRQLTLPEDKWMSVSKIRELLGHEIETHAFRAAAGEKSPLALLSIGLGGYLDAEEGLAISYTQEVARQGAPCKPNKTWIGTLADRISLWSGLRSFHLQGSAHIARIGERVAWPPCRERIDSSRDRRRGSKKMHKAAASVRGEACRSLAFPAFVPRRTASICGAISQLPRRSRKGKRLLNSSWLVQRGCITWMT